MKSFKLIPILLGLLLTINFLIIPEIHSSYDTITNADLTSDAKAIGSDAMNWTMKNLLTNNMITFSDFVGKVVVLSFFTTYTPADALAPEELAQVKSAYSSSKVAIMSIGIDPISDSQDDLIEYADNYNMDWYLFQDAIGVAVYYEVGSTPFFYIIDQNQKVAFSRNGIMDYENFKERIDTLLGITPTTTPNGGETIPEFWQNNWYWFLLGGIGLIIVSALVIVRIRVEIYNKKVRQQKLEKKMQKQRKRIR
ncbi:MAG: TlpA family protein disulfide reductase [Candidatus Thorarchaeota archaeon]